MYESIDNNKYLQYIFLKLATFYNKFDIYLRAEFKKIPVKCLFVYRGFCIYFMIVGTPRMKVLIKIDKPKNAFVSIHLV